MEEVCPVKFGEKGDGVVVCSEASFRLVPFV
jgi:hypothetical protein